jgi:hypothetical protein
MWDTTALAPQFLKIVADLEGFGMKTRDIP